VFDIVLYYFSSEGIRKKALTRTFSKMGQQLARALAMKISVPAIGKV